MKSQIYVYDSTANDPLSKVRGVGRYLQILKESFAKQFNFVSKLEIGNWKLETSTFINPFFNLLRFPLVLKRIAKKQIAVIHDLIPLKYPQHFPVGIKGKINIFLNKLTLKNYDVIVTDSQASKKDIIEILKVDENKIKVVYPCLPKIFTSSVIANEVKQSTRNKIPANFCLYVGDATWNKNLVNLAKAIKIINVTCVFVGKVFEEAKTAAVLRDQSEHLTAAVKFNPWQEELKEFFEIAKNDGRFIFVGFVKDYELIKLYQQATLNILVSRDEGFGFSYLEAASQICPSVLSDIPVLKEISDNKGAMFTKQNDPNEIANTIGEIYFKKEIRNTLSSQALKRVNYFTKDKFKRNFLDILK